MSTVVDPMGTGDLLDLLTADTKTCRDCGQVKPLDEYGRHKRTKDGRQPYCQECASRRARERRERLKTREAVDYPAGKLCPRCGEWGVVVVDPKTGLPSPRAGSDWGVDGGTSDGLNSACRHCRQRPEKRRPRRLQSCPQCDDRPPRELKHFGRVLHADGTESYSEFCRLHHMVNGGLKQCGQCGAWKPATAYHGSASKPDGLDSWCADCKGEYRAENREYYAAYNAAWRAENREYFAAYKAAYYQTDHGRAVRTAGEHRRRARIALADHGCCTPEALEAVKRINGGRCVICDSSDNITIDHVYAISTWTQDSDRSGLHCIQALLPLCHSHNSSRGDKTMHNWLVRLATEAGYTEADAVEYARLESVRLSGLTLTCPDLADPDAFAPPIVALSGRKVWPANHKDPEGFAVFLAEQERFAQEYEARAAAVAAEAGLSVAEVVEAMDAEDDAMDD